MLVSQPQEIHVMQVSRRTCTRSHFTSLPSPCPAHRMPRPRPAHLAHAPPLLPAHATPPSGASCEGVTSLQSLRPAQAPRLAACTVPSQPPTDDSPSSGQFTPDRPEWRRWKGELGSSGSVPTARGETWLQLSGARTLHHSNSVFRGPGNPTPWSRRETLVRNKC